MEVWQDSVKVAFFAFLATVLQFDNIEHENVENIATVLCLREIAVQMLQKLKCGLQ